MPSTLEISEREKKSKRVKMVKIGQISAGIFLKIQSDMHTCINLLVFRCMQTRLQAGLVLKLLAFPSHPP